MNIIKNKREERYRARKKEKDQTFRRKNRIQTLQRYINNKNVSLSLSLPPSFTLSLSSFPFFFSLTSLLKSLSGEKRVDQDVWFWLFWHIYIYIVSLNRQNEEEPEEERREEEHEESNREEKEQERRLCHGVSRLHFLTFIIKYFIFDYGAWWMTRIKC